MGCMISLLYRICTTRYISITIGYIEYRWVYISVYIEYTRGIMKQIGTFRVKVSKTSDKKKLSDGTVKEYDYGSVSLRNPKLTEYIGKEIMIRVFVE